MVCKDQASSQNTVIQIFCTCECCMFSFLKTTETIFNNSVSLPLINWYQPSWMCALCLARTCMLLLVIHRGNFVWCKSRELSANNCLINTLKMKLRVLYLKTQFVPRSKCFSSRYENQSVCVIWGRSHCLFWEKYKTRKYSEAYCKILECQTCWCIT